MPCITQSWRCWPASQPQPLKPDRVVHHLTPAGRAELERWLNVDFIRRTDHPHR
jgi:DNA-binding PadR family transcriptional regulator